MLSKQSPLRNSLEKIRLESLERRQSEDNLSTKVAELSPGKGELKKGGRSSQNTKQQ